MVSSLSTTSFDPIGSEKSKYPEFGVQVGNPHKNFKSTVLKTAFAAATILIISSATAITIGLPVGLAIAGIGVAALAVFKISQAIFFKYHAYRYRLVFDPQKTNVYAPNLGAYSTADLRVSNHVTESFEWKKALITSAKESIEFSPNFAGGENFREILQLIENQMRQYPRLKCHLLLSSDLLEKEDKKYLKVLMQTYPNFNYLITDRIFTTIPSFLSEENHLKMLLVDGKYFVMGGTGVHEKMSREDAPVEEKPDESFGAKLIDKSFRDSDIIGCGSVAQTMRNQFFNLYRIWEYRMSGQIFERFFQNDPEKAGKCELFHQEEGLIKGTHIKYIVSGPEHRLKNPISVEMAGLIEEANDEVRIANLIFNPDEIITRALEKIRAKNIPVNGYFNGTGENISFQHYVYALPNRYNYHHITDVYEYAKKDRLYHKKVMTIDSRYTVVGSFNLGIKSARCDYESVCVIDNQTVTEIMKKVLNDDARDSILLSSRHRLSKWMWSQIPGKLAILALGAFVG